jgi:hypothetical protein
VLYTLLTGKTKLQKQNAKNKWPANKDVKENIAHTFIVILGRKGYSCPLPTKNQQRTGELLRGSSLLLSGVIITLTLCLWLFAVE